MRILFIKYAAIGDVLNATPALRALRSRYPEARIECLVGTWSAAVLEHNPNVDEVIRFDENIFKRRDFRAMAALALALRKRKYDLSVCLHRSFAVNLWVRLVGAKRRLAFLNGRAASRLAHGVVLEDAYRETRQHAIRYYNDVVALAGAEAGVAMDFPLPERTDKVAAYLRDKAVSKRPRIGVCAGGARNMHASESRKRWFLESFAEVIAAMPDCDFMLFGADFDRYTVEHMATQGLPNVLDAVGGFSLAETAQLMSTCDAFLTHDTGLLHIASALGLPTVAVFGPTSWKKHGPLGDNAVVLASDIACSPCYIPTRNAFAPCAHLNCLKEITPEKAVSALRGVLAGAASRPARAP